MLIYGLDSEDKSEVNIPEFDSKEGYTIDEIQTYNNADDNGNLMVHIFKLETKYIIIL